MEALRDGEPSAEDRGEPAVRDAAEFFRSYPQEAAIVLQRSVELSAALSAILVIHCAVLACQAPCHPVDADAADIDETLRILCVARVACMIPRPYWWMQERARFAEARTLPTPQQVARRLFEIQSCPRSAVEEVMRTLYYVWLTCVTVSVCLARLVPEPTPLTQQVWTHLFLNFLCMAAHRLSCLIMFLCLRQSTSLKRGIALEAIDAHSVRLRYRGAAGSGADLLGAFCRGDDCSICLSAYDAGQELRRLSCGHHFHRHCLDPWLSNQRNRCPLCMVVVGLPAC